MSKLLTDLMEAERRRRRLAIGPGGKDAPAKAGDAAFDADEALRPGIEEEHLAAAALSRAAADAEAAAAALARAAAEEKAAREAHRRAERESVEARAAEARLDAERKAGAAQAARVAAEADAAAASERRQGAANALAAIQPAAAECAATTKTAASQSGPQRIGWRLPAAMALTLMAGIGGGVWLGKPPAVPVRTLPQDPGALRLRLDEKLMNPPLQAPVGIPRDRSL